MIGSLRRRVVRDRAAAWILAAVAFRALVPDGFMLDSAGGLGLRVVFCHSIPHPGLLAPPAGQAGAHVHPAAHEYPSADPHAGHHQHHDQPEQDGPPSHQEHASGAGGSHHAKQGQCPFAASSLLAPAPLLAGAPDIHFDAVVVASEPARVVLPRERTRRPGARAPPAYS